MFLFVNAIENIQVTAWSQWHGNYQYFGNDIKLRPTAQGEQIPTYKVYWNRTSIVKANIFSHLWQCRPTMICEININPTRVRFDDLNKWSSSSCHYFQNDVIAVNSDTPRRRYLYHAVRQA